MALTSQSQQLTSSTAAIPASRFPSRENAKGKTTPGTSGRSLLALLAYFDRASSCWKTSQDTFLLDSRPSSLTLPKWGMTHGGGLYELRTPALLTSGQGCLSLLPTPQAQETGRTPEQQMEMKKAMGRNTVTSLAVAAKLLPTPTTDDANNVTRKSGEFLSLARTAHQLLPTPTARDGKGSGQNPEKHRAAKRMTGIEHRNTPDKPWIGAPTNQPSDGGSVLLGPGHPDQLMIGEG